MKLFVTGGSGYIGKHFIKEALKKNFIIFASSRKKNLLKKKNLFWLRGSIEKDWKQLKNCDALIHFACEGVYNKYTPLKKCIKSNLTNSTTLLLNAIKYNCKKWLIISTCSEQQIKKLKYSTKILEKKKFFPFFNYAYSKYLFSKKTLEIAKKHNVKCRVLRLFHVYGGDENKKRLWPSIIDAARKGKDFYMTKGNQIRDFCFIDDVVKELIKALDFSYRSKKFPQDWDVATGKQKTVKKFAKEIWKKNQADGKLIFNYIKAYDNTNYIAKKNKLWKINN